MISHSQDKEFTDENGNSFNQIVPTLANRPRNIVDRMADIIGYAHPIENEETGETATRLYMRGTPRFVAGSRFKYTPNFIDFTYDNLVNAIGDAIDKQAAENGGKLVTEKPTEVHLVKDEVSFDDLMDEFNTLVDKVKEASGDDFKKKWAPKISEITKKHLGAGHKVADCTPSQRDQLELILDDLKDEVGNGL